MTVMNKHLRLLVDNSLEEGQFLGAVHTLDQLRSPDHFPATIHVLHLLFIALHPADHPSTLDAPTTDLLLQSPRKIIKQSKSATLLDPATVRAAHALLHAFLRTNGPAPLALALPSYPDANPGEIEFVDSPIYSQALAIKHARSVWDVLKARAPQTTVVADDAWFLLDWLVALFEADPTVLPTQLPSTRRDASEPLAVALYALDQEDTRRQQTGLHLLSLLIDLTQTPHLHLPAFTSTLLAHLPSTTHALSTLFARLPSTPAALAVKIALCQSILASIDAHPEGDGLSAAAKTNANLSLNLRTKPLSARPSLSFGFISDPANTPAPDPAAAVPLRPRPRPRPIPKALGRAPIEEMTPTASPPPSAPSAPPPPPATPATPAPAPAPAPALPTPAPAQPLPALPALPTIAPLLLLSLHPSADPDPEQTPRPARTHTTSPSSWTHPPPPLLLRVKFELLLAWISLRALKQNTEDNEELEALIDATFGGTDDEEGGEEERMEKKFFRNVLRAFAGLSVDV